MRAIHEDEDDLEADDSSEHVFLGRQPICDAAFNVIGYELLFRNSTVNAADFRDGDRATSQTLLNLFVELDLDDLIGEHRAFVNLTRGFLVGEHPIPFDKDRLVLEVLENIQVDEELIESLRGLREAGYTIALDDVVYHEELEPLLEFANIVKVDLPAVSSGDIERHVAQLRRRPLKLLAEKVETPEEFESCRDLGFDYFQGYFFAKPRLVQAKTIQHNRMIILELLSKLQDPLIAFDEIEALVRQDVAASYKLLRYINSARHSLSRKVESLHQALVLMGLRSIRSVVSLIALSGIEGKPHELMVTAMVRARMCELLAAAMKAPDPNLFFTVGLFSALDALLDRPMADVLKSLPLSEEINRAILEQEGLPGRSLRCVMSYERAEWSQVHCPGVSRARIIEAYNQAIQWTNQMAAALAS